mmetsp:Transcript_1555/g.1871  ORF Transcript_1555/g.1871 Transcript_1555/m.1871 type:complete len:88 (-) Transcript_1555:405-668(-)
MNMNFCRAKIVSLKILRIPVGKYYGLKQKDQMIVLSSHVGRAIASKKKDHFDVFRWLFDTSAILALGDTIMKDGTIVGIGMSGTLYT